MKLAVFLQNTCITFLNMQSKEKWNYTCAISPFWASAWQNISFHEVKCLESNLNFKTNNTAVGSKFRVYCDPTKQNAISDSYSNTLQCSTGFALKLAALWWVLSVLLSLLYDLSNFKLVHNLKKEKYMQGIIHTYYYCYITRQQE
jgi:hypothetical protein